MIKIYSGCADPGWCCDELVLVDGVPKVTLDLTLLTFVGPLFLVRLRAWIDYHLHQGIEVETVAPTAASVRNYMSRMHVGKGLGEGLTFPLPTVRENELADRLIPVTRLDALGDNEFDDLLGPLLEAPDMRHAGHLAALVKETAAEMASNAVGHGRNPVGAYVTAQRFTDRDSSAPHRCIVAIGDMGIGMAEHLRRGGEGRETDALTIAHGMTDMISGASEEFRGRGYSVPFEVARQVSAAWIDLRVRANDGWVLKRGDGEPQGIATGGGTCAGTWVEFQFAHSEPPPTLTP